MRDIRSALFVILGTLCVILGLFGIFIPVLPTTPLLLLAAYFFARSSNRALHWLLNNRWFGPYIRNYHEGRGMAARDKAITLLSLWLTIGLSAVFIVENGWVRLFLIAVASGVTFHLLRIKTYRPDHSPRPGENLIEIE